MTLDADSFLKLCKELRALGACKVEGFGFSAWFPPADAAHLPKPLTQAKKAAKGGTRADEPTAEQKREAMFDRELGRA